MSAAESPTAPAASLQAPTARPLVVRSAPSVTAPTASSLLDVRCPAPTKRGRCGKLLLRVVRPTEGELDLRCPRCGHTWRLDVHAASSQADRHG